MLGMQYKIKVIDALKTVAAATTSIRVAHVPHF